MFGLSQRQVLMVIVSTNKRINLPVYCGASNLAKVRKCLTRENQYYKLGQVIGIPGLSFNYLKNPNWKLGQHYFELYRNLKFVIWGDAIENSITKKTNTDPIPPLTIKQLCEVLKKYQQQIVAIIYNNRKGADPCYKELVETGIEVIDIKKHLISKRKQKNTEYIRDLRRIHPTTSGERLRFESIYQLLRKKLPKEIRAKKYSKSRKNKPIFRKRKRGGRKHKKHLGEH